MRRVLFDTALSAAAITVLVLTLLSFDSRVRERIAPRLSSGPSAAVTTAGRQVEDLSVVLLQAVRDQSIAHAPLVILVFAAGALLLFMLRM